MVKVQIVGSVLTGERIYASTDEPGKAIPESHLPLGAFVIRHHTLLGMAMETCKSRRHGEVNLVKCFVCIVLGINSHQLAGAVENIVESIDMDIKVAIGKSNKTTCRSKLRLPRYYFLAKYGLFGVIKLLEKWSQNLSIKEGDCAWSVLFQSPVYLSRPKTVSRVQRLSVGIQH